MKKVLFFAVVASLLLLTIGACADKPTMPIIPAVGEIWVYELDEGNPFETPTVIEYEVLAIKDGWIQYKNVEGNSIYSVRTLYFILGAHRKKIVEPGEIEGEYNWEPFKLIA